MAGPLLIVLFMLAMILPVSVDAAGLRLTPIRLFLLATFLPVVFKVLRGAAGGFRLADGVMLAFGAWVILTILIDQGFDRISYATILSMEMVGGYFLGRFLIRGPETWLRFMKIFLATLVVMAPFAVVELFTGRQLWAELLDPIGDVTWRHRSSRPRLGMDRVLAGFEHPILFGLYCSLAAANVYYVWKDQIAKALGRFALAWAMTFASLSSGAILAVLLQSLLIVWDKVSNGAWRTLIAVAAAIWLFLTVMSNRGPVVIFIETMTFSVHNAWTRILQWEYGWAEVMGSPIFGIGLSDWSRPNWMTGSIDAFWLLLAMRHGLVGLLLIGTALALICYQALRTKDLDPVIGRYRTGWTIGFVGLVFTLTTVHVWDAISVFVMFYVGAGAWYAETALVQAPQPRSDRKNRLPGPSRDSGGGPPLTRFPEPGASAQRR
ncbi:MAG: hypothetical protein QNJ13_10940 [Paracoccaceae bacterium]|nr:hypothetical protein [Paracoccaceae bacterium]